MLPQVLADALTLLAGGGLSDRAASLNTGTRLDLDTETFVLRERERVNALTSSQGGPDDNDAQAGHLIVQPLCSQARDAATATTWTEQHG